MFRPRHRVSVKIAIYSEDKQRVLVMYYPKRGFYGLPGGHVERHESPDAAVVRELHEELGVAVAEVQHADFFMTDRVILGYTAVVPNHFETFPPKPKFEQALWVDRADLESMQLSAQYAKLIQDNWPV